MRGREKNRFNEFLALGIIVCFLTVSVFAQPKTLDSLQREHMDLRFGMFLHFNMNTYVTGWGNSRVNPMKFNPTKLDCKQWARAAKAAGMKYGLLTTKHHDGFVLWPSKQTPPDGTAPYTIAQSSIPTRDVVQEYVDAFRAEGIAPGIYMSMWDVANNVIGNWAHERSYVLGQINELLGGKYGEIPMFVIDGWSWKMGHWKIPYQEIRAYVKKLQPNCILIDHNGLTSPFEEDLVYYEAPKGVYCPASNTFASCLGSPIDGKANLTGGHWFWAPSDSCLDSLLPAQTIVNNLDTLEKRYCNLILDCPPNQDGLLDSNMVKRLTEVGKLWHPNLARPALPVQMHNILYPVTPDTVFASSNAPRTDSTAASKAWNAIDGSSDVGNGGEVNAGQTLWMSTTGSFPQNVTLDLGSIYNGIDILGCLPRQDLHDFSGRIVKYQVLVSNDNLSFTKVASGAWLGTDRLYRTVSFNPVSTRYVRLQADSCVGGDGIVPGTFATVSEIDVGGYAAEPTTGILFPGIALSKRINATGVYKITGTQFKVPAKFADGKSVASVYDCKGELLGSFLLKNKMQDLGSNKISATGVYLVKVTSLK